MASNPPPNDLATSQLILDKTSGNLRQRTDEERTAAGAGIENNKFIVCPALGVRAKPRRPTLHNTQTKWLRPESNLMIRVTHLCTLRMLSGCLRYACRSHSRAQQRPEEKARI